ncbi:RhoA signaling inhibitor [Sea otter poxvirus]|uniref:RhoA signaling inhibitor n=1 Tax=Sea otter poxvirus TaxID=1416741 RepID=A0A2U9QHH8_9POXV|nr:RhoA signaling inhibitor [Sea otter poxvirus]AWU47060.1 RhoA signaling inhibitor [Sea otter poxvirus]
MLKLIEKEKSASVGNNTKKLAMPLLNPFKRFRRTRRSTQQVQSLLSLHSVISTDSTIKKHVYIEQGIDDSITLRDDVIRGTSQLNIDTISLRDIYQSNEQVNKMVTKTENLDFLLDRDGLFQIAECFMVNLEHGAQTRGILHFGSGSGFVATICLENSGIAGYAIPNTYHITRQAQPGDYTISRLSRGVQFFPQVGGKSTFLLVILSPVKKLLDHGFTVYKPTTCRDITYLSRMIIEDRQRAVTILNNIIETRMAMETAFFNMCKAEDMMKTFKSKGCILGKNLIEKNLTELNYYFRMYIQHSDDLTQLDNYNKVKTSMDCINSLFSTNKYNEYTILYAIQSYMTKSHEEVEKLWGNIRELTITIGKILNVDISCLNKYVINCIQQTSLVAKRNELISKYTALDNMGIPEIAMLV